MILYINGSWMNNNKPGKARTLGNKLVLPLLLLCLSFSMMTLAQTNKFLQQGNKLYDQKKYDEATNSYLKALQKDPNNATGLFNLGNALYQQNHIDSARKVMSATASAIKDKNGKAAANYNVGNTYMAQRKWEDAVASYKNTLRNNPQDVDAKYNLSYAQQMLKKDQNSGGKDKKEDKKDDKKDQQQKKDQQNKDKQGNDKDKDKQQQPQDQDKDKQDDKDQKPQSQPSKMTQQQADQVLNALQQEEKKLQDKLKKEKGIPTKLAKDW